MENKDLDKYVLISQAARILGVCKATLYYWHKTGRLVPEVHPITKIRIYDKRILDKFLLDKKNNKF